MRKYLEGGKYKVAWQPIFVVVVSHQFHEKKIIHTHLFINYTVEVLFIVAIYFKSPINVRATKMKMIDPLKNSKHPKYSE